MKYNITHLLAITGATALAFNTAAFAATHKPAGAPVVVTPAAIPSGSNWARAPFPAARPSNDVTPPNGEAIDQNVAPNTPSTTPEPVAPAPARIAILQPRGEPGLMPTGRPTVGAAVAVDVVNVEPTIRSATFESRDTLIDGLRSRVRQSSNTISEFRHTTSEMSAEGRTQFNSMRDEVKSREKALDRSLRKAEHASAAEWESARAQLAADYNAYAEALARLDAAVGVNPVQR